MVHRPMEVDLETKTKHRARLEGLVLGLHPVLSVVVLELYLKDLMYLVIRQPSLPVLELLAHRWVQPHLVFSQQDPVDLIPH